MKNVNELREHLSNIFQQLQNKSISTNEAAELANLAGKMIASAKVQIEYYSLRKESPVINFLKSEDK
jgi:5-formyltetrahydrofolate cyclo-ligase